MAWTDGIALNVIYEWKDLVSLQIISYRRIHKPRKK